MTTTGEDVFTRTNPGTLLRRGGVFVRGLAKLLNWGIKAAFWLLSGRRPNLTLAGTWYSQIGERIDLQVDPEGAVTGTYSNPVITGDFPLVGQTDPKPFPFAAVKTASFTVRLINDTVNHHVLTSFCGQLVEVDNEQAIVSPRRPGSPRPPRLRAPPAGREAPRELRGRRRPR